MSKGKRERHEPIIPGSFRDLSDSEYYRLSEDILRNAHESVAGAPIVSPKLETSEDLAQQYDFFRKNVYNPKRVFYPCCGLDISPIRGFPESEIVLMDREEGLRKLMKQEGIVQFVQGDVLRYKPKVPFDLVIILNPAVHTRHLTRYLSGKGYAIANNWLSSASELLENRNFEGIGTIDKTENGIYLAKNDFSRLESNQFETYLYVFRKLDGKKVEKAKKSRVL